jgi:hypothetical protein
MALYGTRLDLLESEARYVHASISSAKNIFAATSCCTPPQALSNPLEKKLRSSASV